MSSAPSTSATTLPRAIIRSTPADFVVEEIPAYAPSGRGEHLFVTFRKTDLTTPEAVRRLARALGVSERDAGYAGMKDRHAVTTQTASFPFPAGRDLAEARAVALDGIEILAAERHEHKLRTGHLRGNRFTLHLRGLDAATARALAAALSDVVARGIPNHFGAQRFGRGGDNAERARAWLSGRSRGPRDPRERRLYFSALQSELFNAVLDARVADGTFATLLPGDLARRAESGGTVRVPLDDPAELEALRARHLVPTGPMVGARMPWPEGRPGDLERQVLAASGLELSIFEAHRKLGEGARRPLVLELGELHAEPPATGSDGLVLSFVLPKGGYATTVLGAVCEPFDPHAADRRPPTGPGDAERTEPAEPAEPGEPTEPA
ncbi:MAG: tRNA pseudouridine(13) synthase TruD [Polyangiaceae bacterium]|nr:tRNA pseudouridine(13) synthase TruD [Polyangiaceae bacterium]